MASAHGDASPEEHDPQPQRIADAAPALLWVTDERGDCTYLSPSWYDVTGTPPGSGLGVGWLEAVHPDDRARASEQRTAAREQLTPIQLNYRLRAHDGAYRWIIDSGAPRYDETGTFRGYVGSVIDVQRDDEELLANARRLGFRSQLAEALRVAEDAAEAGTEACRLLGLHLGVARVLMAELTADGQQATVVADYCASGVDHIRGTHLLRRLLPEVSMRGTSAEVETVVCADLHDRPDITTERLEELDRRGIRAHVTVPLVRRGQLVAFFSVHASEPREWTAEEAGVVHETGERAWTATERARAERALRASEERFRRLADSMPQLVWTADIDGTGEYYNRRGDLYDGLVRTAEHEWNWQPILHHEDLERTVTAWHEAVDTNSPYEAEHRIRMKDGTYRWHLSRAERVVTLDGSVQWYGTATDIHALKLADELKDRFLAIASHELRNPVGVIHGTAQQIRRAQTLGTLTPERFEAYLESLLETTTHLASLTNDLTDVSRLQRGVLPLNLGPVDLAALVNEVAAQEEWAPRLRLHGTGHVAFVHADRHRIRQVLTNLIDNALKYSPEAEPVEVRLHRSEEGAVVEVTDHGVGLSSDDLDALFTPFGRGTSAGMVPGLGMGLFIAREVTERHGGRLLARSTGPGQGTTMAFWLPLDGPATSEPRDITDAREDQERP